MDRMFDRRSVLKSLGLAGLAAAGGLLVLSLVGGWLIGRSLSTPVSAMTGAMRRLAEGDLDAEIPVYRDQLGMTVGVREVMPEQGVEAVLLGNGPSYVELIAPVADDTGVARFLAKRGPGMHHVAFAVPHLESTLRTAGWGRRID